MSLGTLVCCSYLMDCELSFQSAEMFLRRRNEANAAEESFGSSFTKANDNLDSSIEGLLSPSAGWIIDHENDYDNDVDDDSDDHDNVDDDHDADDR